MSLIQRLKNKEKIVSAGIVLSLGFTILSVLLLSVLVYKSYTHPSRLAAPYEPTWSFFIMVPFSVVLLLLAKVDFDQYAKRLKIKTVGIIVLTFILISLLSLEITSPRHGPYISTLIFIIFYPAILLSFLSKNWYPKILILMGILLVLVFGSLWVAILLFARDGIAVAVFFTVFSIPLLIGFVDITLGLIKLS